MLLLYLYSSRKSSSKFRAQRDCTFRCKQQHIFIVRVARKHSQVLPFVFLASAASLFDGECCCESFMILVRRRVSPKSRNEQCEYLQIFPVQNEMVAVVVGDGYKLPNISTEQEWLLTSGALSCPTPMLLVLHSASARRALQPEVSPTPLTQIDSCIKMFGFGFCQKERSDRPVLVHCTGKGDHDTQYFLTFTRHICWHCVKF